MEPKIKERTFLDALNEASENLILLKEDLAGLARALHFVGNDRLADKLGTISSDLNHVNQLVIEGRELALSRYLGAVDSGTTNMVKAALAMAQS